MSFAAVMMYFSAIAFLYQTNKKVGFRNMIEFGFLKYKHGVSKLMYHQSLLNGGQLH